MNMTRGREMACGGREMACGSAWSRGVARLTADNLIISTMPSAIAVVAANSKRSVAITASVAAHSAAIAD